MNNIHILPTDKPSRLHLWTDEKGTRLELCGLEYSHTRNTQHIYITSDEEIKEGDWILDNILVNKNPIKVTKELLEDGFLKEDKKIILTTDQELIKDGVQDIPDEFLEWFVNNPSCEQIEVQKWFDGVDFLEYKIIIPKQEPMSYEEFRVNASEGLLEQFDADCLKYSEDGNSDNHFYANCKYWENQLKEELKKK